MQSAVTQLHNCISDLLTSIGKTPLVIIQQTRIAGFAAINLYQCILGPKQSIDSTGA